jgi:membrane-associated phospholipid phosphatase
MLAGLGVVGMAWSRTYLQVHWLTDVIAGALLGIGISLFVFAIAQRYANRGGWNGKEAVDPGAEGSFACSKRGANDFARACAV